MSHQITVLPSGASFSAEADETLLDAALRQGISMPYGCKDGACGACKAKLIEGQVDRGHYQAGALSEADIAAGKLLLCCSRATSDLSLENRQVQKAGQIQVKIMPVRIERMERRTADVMELGLRLPASEKFDFRAGQYIDFLLKDGKRRSYSMANAPGLTGLLELHIRHVPGGLFTEQVFAGMKLKDILRIEGPHGGFYLRDTQQPAILLASGTGFAPIKAMVEHSIAQGQSRPLHIYWGCRSESDLYLPELPQQWATSQPHIRYTPVLSEAGPAWQGRRGLVHAAVLEDYPDLSGHQVYACGAPVMVDAARRDFLDQCRLAEEDFFADAFTFASPGR